LQLKITFFFLKSIGLNKFNERYFCDGLDNGYDHQ
jgi:hypothetical protein